MCLCVRLHEGNPWLLENLKLQLEHYSPHPAVILVDQGSAPAFSDMAVNLINKAGGKYIYDDFAGVYSPSRAHNLAASNVETEFIFFTDPDFFAVSDLFQRFINVLNNTGIASQLDMMLNLPAYHLTQEVTLEFKAAKDSATRTACLERARFAAILGESHSAEFVVPYSNVYLCRTDAFSLAGGYDESFAGHGSEDFEFLLRYAWIMGRYPMPAQPACEMRRPTKESFFYQHKYEGFRALLGAMSFLAESSGLATFHLKHPIDGSSEWRIHNDRKRERFLAKAEPYFKDKRVLLDRDWLPRSKQLLALVSNEPQSTLWLFFRLAGWRLRVVTEEDALSFGTNGEGWGGIDAVAAIYSHVQRVAGFKAIYREAARRGVEFVYIEDKMNPASWSSRSSCPLATVSKESEQEETRVMYDGAAFPLQITSRAYLLSRLGLLTKKQWLVFSKTKQVPEEKSRLREFPTLRKAISMVKKSIRKRKRLLRRQVKSSTNSNSGPK